MLGYKILHLWGYNISSAYDVITKFHPIISVQIPTLLLVAKSHPIVSVQIWSPLIEDKILSPLMDW